MFHVSSAATADMAALPTVLGSISQTRNGGAGLRAGLNSFEPGTEARPTGSNSLRFPVGTPGSKVLRQQFVKHPAQERVRAEFVRVSLIEV